MVNPARSIATFLLAQVCSLALGSGPYRPLSELNSATLDSLTAAGWEVAGGAGEDTRLISSGLAVLLGPFGAHRLYLGTTPKVAIIYGVTFGGFGVLALIDLAHLVFTKDLEVYRDNDRVFMWNGSPRSTPP